jgi:hypothetical protein
VLQKASGHRELESRQPEIHKAESWDHQHSFEGHSHKQAESGAYWNQHLRVWRFYRASTCSTSLAINAKCLISDTFSPSATGERTGAVVVSDSGSGEPQTIELTRTGE